MAADAPSYVRGPVAAHWAARVAAARDALAADIVARVEDYAPRLAGRELSASTWQRVAPLVRDAVLLALPVNAEVAADYAGSATDLAGFAAAACVPLRADTVFAPGTVTRYLDTATEGSRPTHKARLNVVGAAVAATLAGEVYTVEAREQARAAGRAAAARTAADNRAADALVRPPLLAERPQEAPAAGELAELGLAGPGTAELLAVLAAVREAVLAERPDALRPQPPRPGNGLAVPYGDVELVGLLRGSARQRAVTRGRHQRAAVLLGVGAGLTGMALASVHGTDVVAVPGPQGPHAAVRTGGRLVAVLPPAAPAVLALAERAGSALLLGGNAPRANRVTDLATKLRAAAPRTVGLDSWRLRATWAVVHLLAGTYLPTLFTLADRTSTEWLAALLPYLPADRPAETAGLAAPVAAALAAVAAHAPAAEAGQVPA